ncbi:MAG: right-handed parallel beta-helix repeat-containing protein [Phycisphaerae bacterium]|jgi:hypothetical protein
MCTAVHDKISDCYSFFVAKNGNDTWSGTLAEPDPKKQNGPFASLERARQAVRKLVSSGKLDKPVKILVREGIYFLEKPFKLTHEDSGTEKTQICYQSYPGEKAILSGGRVIENWHKSQGQLWETFIPEVKEQKWYFRQLFVNEKRCCRARLPKEGNYFRIQDVFSPDKKMETIAFKFIPADFQTFKDIKNAEVVNIHSFDTSRLKIDNINNDTNTIRLANTALFPFIKDRRYYIENIYEGLCEPGCWYLDANKGILYYWPRAGEQMSDAKVIAPRMTELINLEGDIKNGKYVEHVIIRDFHLQHADWVLPSRGYQSLQAAEYVNAAVHTVEARNCCFIQNELSQIGIFGFQLGVGSKNNSIIANKIYDMGAGGVKVGRTEDCHDDPEYFPVDFPEIIRRVSICDNEKVCGNIISDNYIYDGGKVFMGAVGIWVGQSGNNLISHNEIYNLYYTGISVGWSWTCWPTNHCNNIIEYNYIHEVLKETLSDGGGIYTLGVSPGTVIRNNVIHDVYSYNNNHACGIYLDASSSGIVIENNIVYRTSCNLIKIQIGISGNIIRNNIFAFGKGWQIGFDSERTNIFQQNIVYFNEGKLFSPKRNSKWSSFDHIIDFNIYFNENNDDEIKFLEYTFDQWRQIQPRPSWNGNVFEPLDVHSFIIDPLFVDPANGDFDLKPDSPAFRIGFCPIDRKSVGPR